MLRKKIVIGLFPLFILLILLNTNCMLGLSVEEMINKAEGNAKGNIDESSALKKEAEIFLNRVGIHYIPEPEGAKIAHAKFYNENQIRQLLAACEGDILENVIKLSLFYGTRRSDEIIGIKWDAVDFENNLLTIKHTAVQMGTKIHRNDSTKNSSSYRSFTIPPFIKIQN